MTDSTPSPPAARTSGALRTRDRGYRRRQRRRPEHDPGRRRGAAEGDHPRAHARRVGAPSRFYGRRGAAAGRARPPRAALDGAPRLVPAGAVRVPALAQPPPRLPRRRGRAPAARRRLRRRDHRARPPDRAEGRPHPRTRPRPIQTCAPSRTAWGSCFSRPSSASSRPASTTTKKMARIIARTWRKMSERGREAARGLDYGERARSVLERAAVLAETP